MSFIVLVIIIVASIGLLLTVFLGYRNQAVYRVRIALIGDSLLYDAGAYYKLPSHDAMLFNPSYWHLWTKQQWVEETV